MIHKHLTATDSKLSDLSSAVERLTDIMASLMLNHDSAKSFVASPSRVQTSKNEIPVQKPKSFPGVKEVSKKTTVHSDFAHEKKAVSLSSSEALKKLMGNYESKGSSFIDVVDEPLTFNDLFSRGTPPNQKFERLTTKPNKYLDLTASGDLIVPLLGLTLQPVNT